MGLPQLEASVFVTWPRSVMIMEKFCRQLSSIMGVDSVEGRKWLAAINEKIFTQSELGQMSARALRQVCEWKFFTISRRCLSDGAARIYSLLCDMATHLAIDSDRIDKPESQLSPLWLVCLPGRFLVFYTDLYRQTVMDLLGIPYITCIIIFISYQM